MVYMQSNLQLLSRKDEGYNCIKKERQYYGTFVDMHDPLDDGAGLVELAELSLNEPNLEVVFFLKMITEERRMVVGCRVKWKI